MPTLSNGVRNHIGWCLLEGIRRGCARENWREKREEKNKGQWRTKQWINSGSKGGEILPPCSDDDKRKLTIFCHGSLVQTHPWNWWEFNGLESTLSLMYFLAHRSQLKLNSAFCKIKLDTLVCYSESLILVGRSWAKLLKEKKKKTNNTYGTLLVTVCEIAIIAQVIFKEIKDVWVTFPEMKDCFTGSCYWLLFL